MDVGVDQAGENRPVLQVEHGRIAHIDIAGQKLRDFVLANNDRRRAERALAGNRDHGAGMDDKVCSGSRRLRGGSGAR